LRRDQNDGPKGKDAMKFLRPVSGTRKIVQLIFFIIVLLVVIAHSLEEAGIVVPLIQGASLHAICPFGGVVTLYQFFSSGTFVQKIHESSLYLMLLVLVTAIFAGPVFCGWACPFGTFQEWMAKIGRRIFGKKYNRMIPKRVDSLLRYLRYVVLVWVVIVTATSAKLVFSDYDPYYALFNFWTGEVAIGAFISLGMVIVLSLFVERPFCKYACPYGAVLGLSNLFRIFGLRRNTETCISCNKCDKACPMNLSIANKKIVRDHQCISCLECTSEAACPVDTTLELSTKKLGSRPTVEGGLAE
jgi:polyferredoxin